MMNCKQEVSKIVEFIKEIVKDAGAKGVVLGLSGGLDSAVVMALCIKALGKNVECRYFSDKFVDDSLIRKDAIRLLKFYNMSLNYDRYVLDSVMELFNAYYGKNDRAKGNFKSRLMMNFLRAEAELNEYLLIGTTNKSEYLIGYFTKYGDGGVDFEPIQHLYKTDIYKLAKYLKVPQVIIDKKPSADLWEGQTDEDEIGMSYKLLDEYLDYIENGYAPLDSKGYKRVVEMMKTSEHKRRLPRCLK